MAAFAVRLISREQNENANIHKESKGFNTNQLDDVSNVVRAQEGSSMALTNTDGDVANMGVSLDLKSYCLQTFQKQHPRRNDNYKSKTKSTSKDIVAKEIQSIDINPSCPNQLDFHLDDGWYGVLDFHNFQVTHTYPLPSTSLAG
ncbi:unnamed protein product [Lactuca virosa]|uniref:Uncharacterized protein n=1 Tax=Lactuca virosa TaxID=75947 RepID=A0AAU9NBD6_9ASTR|nr:unnamed protein product [Lactuca virosa]